MDNLTLKIAVLKQLRKHFHEAAVTRDPSPINVLGIAGEVGHRKEGVQGMIAELLSIGFAQPTTSAEHLAVEGNCRITPQGLTFLDQYEAQWHEPSTPKNPIGFRLSS
jgi:hypothetical protein